MKAPRSYSSAVTTSSALPLNKVAAATGAVAVTYSKTLFGDRRELVIEHAGCWYRLRITQNNKLILTK